MCFSRPLQLHEAWHSYTHTALPMSHSCFLRDSIKGKDEYDRLYSRQEETLGIYKGRSSDHSIQCSGWGEGSTNTAQKPLIYLGLSLPRLVAININYVFCLPPQNHTHRIRPVGLHRAHTCRSQIG